MTISDPIAGLAEMRTLIETPGSVAMLDFAFAGTRGQRPADFATMPKFRIFTALIVLGAW